LYFSRDRSNNCVNNLFYIFKSNFNLSPKIIDNPEMVKLQL